MAYLQLAQANILIQIIVEIYNVNMFKVIPTEQIPMEDYCIYTFTLQDGDVILPSYDSCRNQMWLSCRENMPPLPKTHTDM